MTDKAIIKAVADKTAWGANKNLPKFDGVSRCVILGAFQISRNNTFFYKNNFIKIRGSFLLKI